MKVIGFDVVEIPIKKEKYWSIRIKMEPDEKSSEFMAYGIDILGGAHHTTLIEYLEGLVNTLKKETR